ARVPDRHPAAGRRCHAEHEGAEAVVSKEPPPPTPTPASPPLERIVTMRPPSLRPGVEQGHQPIVPKARWRVTCNDCGAAFASADFLLSAGSSPVAYLTMTAAAPSTTSAP